MLFPLGALLDPAAKVVFCASVSVLWVEAGGMRLAAFGLRSL
jgi:hypothetical protein